MFLCMCAGHWERKKWMKKEQMTISFQHIFSCCLLILFLCHFLFVFFIIRFVNAWNLNHKCVVRMKLMWKLYKIQNNNKVERVPFESSSLSLVCVTNFKCVWVVLFAYWLMLMCCNIVSVTTFYSNKYFSLVYVCK